MRSWAGLHLLASDSRGLVTLLRLLRDQSSSFSEDAGLQDVSPPLVCSSTVFYCRRDSHRRPTRRMYGDLFRP